MHIELVVILTADEVEGDVGFVAHLHALGELADVQDVVLAGLCGLNKQVGIISPLDDIAAACEPPAAVVGSRGSEVFLVIECNELQGTLLHLE